MVYSISKCYKIYVFLQLLIHSIAHHTRNAEEIEVKIKTNHTLNYQVKPETVCLYSSITTIRIEADILANNSEQKMDAHRHFLYGKVQLSNEYMMFWDFFPCSSSHNVTDDSPVFRLTSDVSFVFYDVWAQLYHNVLFLQCATILSAFSCWLSHFSTLCHKHTRSAHSHTCTNRKHAKKKNNINSYS